MNRIYETKKIQYKHKTIIKKIEREKKDKSFKSVDFRSLLIIEAANVLGLFSLETERLRLVLR